MKIDWSRTVPPEIVRVVNVFPSIVYEKALFIFESFLSASVML